MKRALAVAFVCVALTACGDTGSRAAPDDEADATPGKYEQTWTAASYGETRCTDWADEMTAHERWVAAADMLFGARRQDGDEELPPHRLVDAFHDAIDEVCTNEGGELNLTISEVAAPLYVLSADFRP